MNSFSLPSKTGVHSPQAMNWYWSVASQELGLTAGGERG